MSERAFFHLGEDQTAGAGLERARNDDGGYLPEVGPRMIDDDHCAIRQIADGLVRFPAFLDQVQFELITGGGAWPQGTREIGEIQGWNLLQARDLTESLIVRQQARLENLGGPNQASINGQVRIAGRFVNG